MGGGGANSLNSPKTGDNGENHLPENGEEYTVTYRTYDDYFTYYNITSETISKQDLTGTGSSSDPFVVHSTKGFLFLTNYSLSKTNLRNKYVSIECDIVLNDEVFDENGNPSGGDGIVYSWSHVTKYTAGYFEGNGHYIKGAYFKDDAQTKSNISLFGEVLEMRNLTIENSYLKAGKYVFGVASRMGLLENVHAKNIYLTGVGDVAGISNIFSGQAKNCSFSGKISNSSSRTGGLFLTMNGKDFLYACVNYADMNCVSVSGGLVAQNNGGGVRIKDCINYGNLNCSAYSNGGALGISSGNCVISNFKNYGNISSTSNDIGGIVGRQDGDLVIESCFNAGKIETPSSLAGEFVGNIRNDTSKRSLTCFIRDFEIYSYSAKPIVAGSNVTDTKEIYVDIERGKIFYDTEKSLGVVALAIFTKDEYCLRASEIHIIQKNENLNLSEVVLQGQAQIWKKFMCFLKKHR